MSINKEINKCRYSHITGHITGHYTVMTTDKLQLQTTWTILTNEDEQNKLDTKE